MVAASSRKKSALEFLALGRLLAEHLQQVLRAAAADDLLELRAEVRHQAHLLDDEVDHLPLPVRLPEPVVDGDVVRAAATQDLGLDGPVAVWLLAIAHDGDLLVVVVVEAAPVGRRQVPLELALELLLLLGAELAPVARQDETAEGVEVDVLEHDLLHLVPPRLLREALVGQDGEHLIRRALDDLAGRLLGAGPDRESGQQTPARDRQPTAEMVMEPCRGLALHRWGSSRASPSRPDPRSTPDAAAGTHCARTHSSRATPPSHRPPPAGTAPACSRRRRRARRRGSSRR